MQRKFIFFSFFCLFPYFFLPLHAIMNYNLLHHKLIDWYEQNHRILPWRDTTNPYHIWISEIILQQTRVVQGMEYYLRFVNRFPNIHSLASAEEDEVLLYWQGLGYYSRARNLHKAAQLMIHSPIFNGDYTSLSADEVFVALRTMPGVGDYTAGAIASFAFNLPYPALDGNVYRVLARLFDCDIAFDTTEGKKYFRKLAEQLLDYNRPRLFNSAIMELGALHCIPSTPDCNRCPLLTWCQAHKNNTVELLPIRKQRPKLRERYFVYTIYLSPQKTTLIHQRKENDIWKHLYEFPLQEYIDGFDKELPTNHVAEFTHVLSHQRIHARFYLHNVSKLPNLPNNLLIQISDIDNYALSKLTLNALKTCEKKQLF